jgi:hypothetical protein
MKFCLSFWENKFKTFICFLFLSSLSKSYRSIYVSVPCQCHVSALTQAVHLDVHLAFEKFWFHDKVFETNCIRSQSKLKLAGQVDPLPLSSHTLMLSMLKSATFQTGLDFKRWTTSNFQNFRIFWLGNGVQSTEPWCLSTKSQLKAKPSSPLACSYSA